MENCGKKKKRSESLYPPFVEVLRTVKSKSAQMKSDIFPFSWSRLLTPFLGKKISSLLEMGSFHPAERKIFLTKMIHILWERKRRKSSSICSRKLMWKKIVSCFRFLIRLNGEVRNNYHQEQNVDNQFKEVLSLAMVKAKKSMKKLCMWRFLWARTHALLSVHAHPPQIGFATP